MATVVISVRNDATISELGSNLTAHKIADTMIGGRFHRLVVKDGDRIAGIVTTLDLLKGLRSRI